jgi:hypothetical protein
MRRRQGTVAQVAIAGKSMAAQLIVAVKPKNAGRLCGQQRKANANLHWSC